MPTCALCLNDVEKLEESHILPAWAYRRVRGECGRIVRVAYGRADRSDRQVKLPLLCRACEELLNPAETYVSKVSYQRNGTCPLLEMVGHAPGSSRASRGGFSVRPAVGVETNRLAQFAAGVIWKAYVAKEANFGPVTLGSRYAEALRRYLLGASEFPEAGLCSLAVYEYPAEGQPREDQIASSPVSDRSKGQWTHHFLCAGFEFWLWLGGRRTAEERRLCLVRGKPGAVFVTDPMNLGMVRTAIDYVGTSTRSRRMKSGSGA